MWFNDPSVNTYLHKTISALANENSPFCLGSQKVNELNFLFLYLMISKVCGIIIKKG